MMEFSSVHRQRTVEALKEVFVAVERFQPEATEVEKRWQIPLRVQKGWQQLDLIDYQGVLFLSLGSELNCTYDQLKRTVGGTLQVKHRDLLREVYQSLCDISRQVAKDPLAYHKEMLNHLSPTIRFGTISRQFCRILLPDWNRFDRELSPREYSDSVELLRRAESRAITDFTAGQFFRFCKIAYLANPQSFQRSLRGEVDPSLSGRELYERYADGRDAGLLDIELDDPLAFKQWYLSNARSGAHPWEIYRGGNATHIDLGVMSEGDLLSEGFKVFLRAPSSSRLVEACRIALALDQAGVPFEWCEKESYLARLQGEDSVGIVPFSQPLLSSAHRFPKEFKVFDCIHFDMLRDFNSGKPLAAWSTIKGVISWLPIRPLMLARGQSSLSGLGPLQLPSRENQEGESCG